MGVSDVPEPLVGEPRRDLAPVAQREHPFALSRNEALNERPVRALAAHLDGGVQVLLPRHIGRPEIRQKPRPVPRITEARLDHAREPHRLGGQAGRRERVGGAGGRNRHVAAGGPLDGAGLVERRQQHAVGAAADGDPGGLPRPTLGVAEDTRPLSERQHDVDALALCPHAQLCEGRHGLAWQAKAATAVARPRGQRPRPARHVQDRRGRAQRVLPQGHGQGARAAGRHRERQPHQRQDRGAGACARDSPEGSCRRSRSSWAVATGGAGRVGRCAALVPCGHRPWTVGCTHSS